MDQQSDLNDILDIVRPHLVAPSEGSIVLMTCGVAGQSIKTFEESDKATYTLDRSRQVDSDTRGN